MAIITILMNQKGFLQIHVITKNFKETILMIIVQEYAITALFLQLKLSPLK